MTTFTQEVKFAKSDANVLPKEMTAAERLLAAAEVAKKSGSFGAGEVFASPTPTLYATLASRPTGKE